jgi:hypothetical protein
MKTIHVPGTILFLSASLWAAGCDDDPDSLGGSDADTDADADTDSDTGDGDCPGVDDAILGGSCTLAGFSCNEWSVDDTETQYEEMVDGWEGMCVDQGGTWTTEHCDLTGAVGICEDDTIEKVITVYYEGTGLTVAEIEEGCSNTCQVFSLP